MFRPCIDLHQGKVKQIVGGSLSEDERSLRTNFTSERPSSWYADLYQRDGLQGGHVIKLGPGNDEAAGEALAAYPGGLQIGGGITLENAELYLSLGASHVIVTSWLFDQDQLNLKRLSELSSLIGRERLVVDLSCRLRNKVYYVVTNRWQTFTSLQISNSTLQQLSEYCSEFLIHAADVEGLCQGIDFDLVELLAEASPIPTTYAGGAKSLEDLEAITRISRGEIDLTIGSALDIFGGSGVAYSDVVAFNRRTSASNPPKD